MSGTVLAEERPVARKAHHCDVCLGTIGAGDRYLRQRNVGDDGPYVFKAHALCWSLSLFIAERLDYWTDDGEWPEPMEVREGIAAWFATIAGPPSAASRSVVSPNPAPGGE